MVVSSFYGRGLMVSEIGYGGHEWVRRGGLDGGWALLGHGLLFIG
jgi:hypothetical protein